MNPRADSRVARRGRRLGGPLLVSAVGLGGLLFFFFCCCCFCCFWETADAPIPEGAVVVVDGRPFTADELRERLGIDRFDSEALVHEAVEELAVRFLLEREAARRGEPAIGVAEMMERLVEEMGGPPRVREEDLQAAYEADRERYVAPRQVRIGYLSAPYRDDRDSARAAIGTAQTLARMSISAGAGSRKLAAPRSLPVLSGEVGPVACDEKNHPILPALVIERACALPLGALSSVIETAEAFWLVRKRGDHPARHVTFEQARSWIRDELRADARRAAQRTVRARLLEGARIQVPDDLLARLPTHQPATVEKRETNGPPAPPGSEMG